MYMPYRLYSGSLSPGQRTLINQESVCDTTATRSWNCLKMPQNHSQKAQKWGPIPPRSLWAILIRPTPTWNSDPPEPRILDRTLLPEVMLQPHAYLGDTLRGFNTKIGSRNREWLPGIYILHRCMLGVVQLRGMCRTGQQLVQQLQWFVECMVS